MAEFSDLMSDFAPDIRRMCQEIPGAELMETLEEWCAKLDALGKLIDERKNIEDTVCVFIGLEIANVELSRLPEKNGNRSNGSRSFLDTISKYATPVGGSESLAEPAKEEPNMAFNATPIIDKLFSSGARNGIRCVTEASVYRQFSKILKIKDMCRHKVAFSMSADDCLMYLGNSNFQKSIGQNAVYGDGGKEVKKLLPYKL